MSRKTEWKQILIENILVFIMKTFETQIEKGDFLQKKSTVWQN